MRLHKQVFVLLFAVLACGARAQDYPNRPIRILVPNAPGSSVDTMTRILTTRLGEALGGASIVVEDRDGAGGLIGMDAGRKAAPDGYTLITVSNGSGVIAPLLKKVRPYDTAQDFELIGSFAITPNVLVVNPQLPVNSVKELIDYARAHRATINMASAGIGSQSHLAGALLMTMGNFESLHVPHKGGGPSVGSVAAGQTHWTLTPAPAAMAQVKAGRLAATGPSLPRRSSRICRRSRKPCPATISTAGPGSSRPRARRGRSSSGCRLRWRRRSRRPRCAMALPARAPISSPAIRRNSASSSRRTWPIPSAS